MTTQQKVLWAIVVVIVLGGFYWWWSSSQSQSMVVPPTGTPVTQQTTSVPGSSNASTGTTTPVITNVTYDGSSFLPSSVTIPEGGTVTWTSTAGGMWIASNPHPIHNGYDGTTVQEHCAPGYTGAAPFDECAPGTTWSFTFTKVGTWGYHNHLSAGVKGTVTVIATQ
jgi:plastocyanin